MNIVEELVKKYEGKYSEEVDRGINYPTGKYTFYPQRGIIKVDGTIISINIKAVGGAARTAEPYRIMLELDKDYGISPFRIFPKSTVKKITGSIFANDNLNIPDPINKQFSFKGNDALTKALVSDYTFCDNIKNEKVYILISEKYPQHIVLTPAYGIDDLVQFEKFLNILKFIESKVKRNST